MDFTPILMLWHIALGGAVGSVLRYLVGGWVQPARSAFPWGTLAVNVSGALALGVLARVTAGPGVSAEVRAALTVGLCGGFTTFSTFSYETLALIQRGDWARALVYVGVSVLASLGAVAVGVAIVPR